MTLSLTPITRLPECPEIGDDVMRGSRAAAVAMSESAEVMQRHAAPPRWEGDEAVLANHQMTATAKRLGGSVAALELGIAALDEYSDTIRTTLAPQHADHQKKDEDLRAAERTLVPLLTKDDDETKRKVAEHNAKVEEHNGVVARRERRLRAAEDIVIAALRKVDTIAEGAAATSTVPNVPALLRHAKSLKDPRKIFTWWKGLDRDQREALKTMVPEIVGNLNGIPIVDRDEANRAHMSALRDSIEQREPGERTARDKADLKKIRGVEKGLGKADGYGVPTYLMVFEPRAARGDGHAAIAFGNPETAKDVTINVPGLTSEMKNFDSVSGNAWNVARAGRNFGGESLASIAWLGYDAPSGGLDPLDFAGVGREDKAAEGARNLSSFVDGLHATREHPMHLTVIGHSYGSTAVAKAAGDGMDADDIVLVGSPGAGDGNTTASDLHANVYVGSSDQDPVTRLGNPSPVGLGGDPASSGFGAHRFHVDDGHRFAWTPLGLKNGLDNHTSYFDKGSGSLDNIAKIGIGQGDKIHEVAGRSAASNPAWWTERNEGALRDRVLAPITAAHQYGDPYARAALDHGQRFVEHAGRELAEQQRGMIEEHARRLRQAGEVVGREIQRSLTPRTPFLPGLP